MPTRVNASNAVVGAVCDAAALFNVPAFRMNTRTVEVVGVGGRSRPMFFGQWTDDLGVLHRKGMADLLLTPRIAIWTDNLKVTVPLWVECKSGSGELEPDQILFRDFVLRGGAYYLEAHDCADVVIQWFSEFGVVR